MKILKLIDQGRKEFIGWIRNNLSKAIPIVAVAITLGILTWEADNYRLPLFLCYLVILIIFGMMIWGDIKRPMVVLLCARLMAPMELDAQLEEQKGVAVGVGVGCLIGGTVIAIILYNTCKKLYKKQETNSPPELFLSAAGGGGDSYAAIDCWFDGYCYQNDLKSVDAVTGSLVEGSVNQDGNIIGFGLVKEKDQCSYEEFRAAMEAHGVPLTYGQHYAKNGKPCEPWEVPVTISHGKVPTIAVTCDGAVMITRVVERSYDFVEWMPVITNTVPACYQVRFTDISDGPQAFYRTREIH